MIVRLDRIVGAVPAPEALPPADPEAPGAERRRGTPATDEKALEEVGLTAKTANGPVDAPLTIAERPFGYAAARVPKLGADVGIVVLRSEI